MYSPLNTLRVVRGLWRLFLDPNRLDEVFEVASALLTPELLDQLAEEVAKDPHGANALKTRHRLGQIDLTELTALDEGTLGRSFAEFLIRNGLDPTPLTAQADREGDYLIAHLYETHDLWHVLTGADIDVAGELELQAFYLAQIPGNLGAVLIAVGLLNAVFFDHDEVRPRLGAVSRGWRMGRDVEPLVGRDWASVWTTPLTEVRKELGIRRVEVVPSRFEPVLAG